MTNNFSHFEELWEACERHHQNGDAVSSILEELSLKIQLYNKISSKLDSVAKEQLFGEILFSLTKLSQIDNINVFAALKKSLISRI